jgi:hypothetical protein
MAYKLIKKKVLVQSKSTGKENEELKYFVLR